MIILDDPVVVDGITYDHLMIVEFQLELSGDGVSTMLNASLAPARIVDGELTVMTEWLFHPCTQHISIADVRPHMAEQAALGNSVPAEAWNSTTSLLVQLLDGVHE